MVAGPDEMLPENAGSVFGRNRITRIFVIMTDQLKIEPIARVRRTICRQWLRVRKRKANASG